MSTKNLIKLFYCTGMGFLGKNVGEMVSAGAKSDVEKAVVKMVGAVTGVYAGLIIADDLDVMISNAIDDVSKEEKKDVEVNNGWREEEDGEGN